MALQNSYPLPRRADRIDSFSQAKVFSALDAFSYYRSMDTRQEDRRKSEFVMHSGTYQYTRTVLGLNIAPASFQRALDFILMKYKLKTCLVYFVDIIIFSISIEKHMDHVDKILASLKDAEVTLMIKKYKFFMVIDEYLGHIVRPGNTEDDQVHTASLKHALLLRTNRNYASF